MRKSSLIACGVTAAAIALPLLLVVASASGAPVLSGTAEVKSAVASAMTEARWYGWRRRYFVGRGYGWRRYGSGCHMAGGYHRPSLCW